MRKSWLTLLFGLGLAAAASAADPQPVTVFAAASTTDAVKELGDRFTKDTGIPVRLNFGSSGDLVHQMEQNSPADVFLSAAKNWADYAVAHQLVDKASARPFLTNDLVVVAPLDTKLQPFKIDQNTPFGTLFQGRLSVGDPAHVQAGKYAEAALKHYGWYQGLQSRLLPAANVRSALMVVELGEAELGIVYSTDAMKSKKVKCLAVFPPAAYPKIVYVLALGKNASPAAVKFYDLLLSRGGAEVFQKYGFAALK